MIRIRKRKSDIKEMKVLKKLLFLPCYITTDVSCSSCYIQCGMATLNVRQVCLPGDMWSERCCWHQGGGQRCCHIPHSTQDSPCDEEFLGMNVRRIEGETFWIRNRCRSALPKRSQNKMES